MTAEIVTLSPSIHEALIARHRNKGADDAALDALHDAVKLARENCVKASQVTRAVLSNQMQTLPQRHKAAREATFDLLEKATRSLDAAMKDALAEVAAIHNKTKGPPVAKDPLTEARQRELRERLAALPEDHRKQIIAEAIQHDDDLLTGAVLNSAPWLIGLTKADLDLHRHSWAAKHHAADMDRMHRLQLAVADSQRAGTLTIAYIDHLTDQKLIAEAETMERKAAEALKAAKNG